MTEKLIPVQLPLDPAKAHLYRIREGGTVKELAKNNDEEYPVFAKVTTVSTYRNSYTEDGYYYSSKNINDFDITHEVVEDINTDKARIALEAECPRCKIMDKESLGDLNYQGCMADLDDLLEFLISHVEYRAQDVDLKSYLKKNYPREWEKYSEEGSADISEEEKIRRQKVKALCGKYPQVTSTEDYLADKHGTHKHKLTAEQQIRVAALNAAVTYCADREHYPKLTDVADELNAYITTGEIRDEGN